MTREERHWTRTESLCARRRAAWAEARAAVLPWWALRRRGCLLALAAAERVDAAGLEQLLDDDARRMEMA